MKSLEFSKDVSKHFQEDFMSNSNSGKETAETKLMGNISDLKYAIAELK